MYRSDNNKMVSFPLAYADFIVDLASIFTSNTPTMPDLYEKC